jgi:putative aldouronate transport system substrate-binding protein
MKDRLGSRRIMIMAAACAGLIVLGSAAWAAPASSATEYTKNTTPFTFDLWWAADWGFNKPAIEAGWDASNPVYQAITKATGVTINFIKPPGAEKDLLGPMLASGKLPDVMVLDTPNSPFYGQMREAGQILSWTDLINKYCPNMWSVLPKSVVQLHTEADGKMWQLVSMQADSNAAKALQAIGTPPTTQTNVCFVRKDILAAYGKKDIGDINDLTSYLKFAKSKYPSVEPMKLFSNGDPRSGADACFRHLGATFGCHLSGAYPVGDGTVKHFMYDPHYVDYLKWFNGLYRDGIISANMLAEDNQAQQSTLYSGNYAFLAGNFWDDYNTANAAIVKNLGSDAKTYTDVGPIKKDGKWICADYGNQGAMGTVITASAKSPERIILAFEYLNTPEGQKTLAGGPEGWCFNYKDNLGIGKAVPLPDAGKMASTDLQGFTTKYKVAGPWSFVMQDEYWEYYLGLLMNPPAGYITKQMYTRLNPYITPVWYAGFMNITVSSFPVGSDLDVLHTKINNICKESAMKMIAASSDAQFTQIYKDCIKQIEANGVDKVNKAFTAEYQQDKKKLGLK